MVHLHCEGQEGDVKVFIIRESPLLMLGVDETRYVVILGVPPVRTPLDAVRAYIVTQYKNKNEVGF